MKLQWKDGFKRLLAAACCLLMLPVMPAVKEPAPAKAADVIANPFIYSDVPDDDIIRVGDTYYMVHTTMFFTPGVPIMKSTDLYSWEICNYVYDKYADGDVQNLANGKHDYAHGQWATSLRYHDGMYYVFFGSYGTGNSYIYKTDDIENGTWSRTEIRGMYHDASMLFDTDGRKYLVYGSGTIHIKEFNDEMTDFKWGGLDKDLFATGLSGLAGEGSHIHKIGDWYYVFIIAWPSGHPRIELCYRSKSLSGSWEGKTVLESGLGTYGSGVAQGGIIDTPNGDWYALLFQDHGAVGRIPVLVPFTWQNDWPVMGVNGKAPVTLEVSSTYTGTQLAHTDEFDSDRLALEWQWNHNPDNTAWSLTENPGYLRLKNKTVTDKFFFARNTLTMRTEGPACSGYVKLDTSGMKAGDYAGLSAFQHRYGNVGVYVGDDGRKHVYMANNTGGDKVDQEQHHIVAQADMQGDTVYLKVDFQFATVDSNYNVSNNIDKANFFYSFDGNNWTKIGDQLSMGYSLTLFTGYRFGLYSYPTKSGGGYADFDGFYYDRADWNLPLVIEPDPDGYWFHYTFEKNTESFSGRSGETLSTSTAEAYAGEKALSVTDRSASWNGAAHSLSSMFKSGEKYSFSVVAKSVSTAPETFHFTLSYKDASGETQYEKIATETAEPGEWVQLANQAFAIPAGASGMQIYVETAEGDNSFYIDEMIGAPEGTVIDGPGGTKVTTTTEPETTTTTTETTTTEPEIIASPAMPGDVDCSSDINVADAVLLARFLAEDKDISVSAQGKRNADCNEDGDTTSDDLTIILEYLAGIRDKI